ncbi:hypothetical protein [Rhizobium sp. PL01]|nr:hypothetical protein [Rhizobium sp. PL01]MDW5318484.1 hypothetical protein [Rhizobium sp. PL01]
MDDDILIIGMINLLFGILALTVGYLYTLPRNHLAAQLPAAPAIPMGER